MSKVPILRVVSKNAVAEFPDLPDEVRVALSEAAVAAREGLLAMSVATGLQVMHAMFESEITTLAGPRGKHDAGRTVARHGSADSSVTLGARRVRVERPRARTTDGQEVQLASFAAFAGDDLLSSAVMSRMLAGLACRQFRAGQEPIGEEAEAQAGSTSRSAVSRRFVKATSTALAELLARDLSELNVAAMLIDGMHLGEHLMVVALAITTDGAKVPVGLYDGDTENTTVVAGLLADLVERGLDTDGSVLFVLDGAKALSKGVRKVFGTRALIQRCTLHKRRNVADHLPDKEKAWIDTRLVRAFTHPDPDLGLRAARELATTVERTHPSAAGSIREGLEEMFTVRRLGLSASLERSLLTTNAIWVLYCQGRQGICFLGRCSQRPALTLNAIDAERLSWIRIVGPAARARARSAWLEESLHDSTQICRHAGPALSTVIHPDRRWPCPKTTASPGSIPTSTPRPSRSSMTGGMPAGAPHFRSAKKESPRC